MDDTKKIYKCPFFQKLLRKSSPQIDSTTRNYANFILQQHFTIYKVLQTLNLSVEMIKNKCEPLMTVYYE